jgi:formamidopyrimidine-DNA glycosylase
MPELPDIVVYIEALRDRVLGQTLLGVRLASPFLLRTAVPPIMEAHGKNVLELRRIGKRIAFGLEDELFLVIHLMIAGRLRWHSAKAKILGKIGLAALDFPSGTLILTEASSKKRASLHLLRGKEAVAGQSRGGLEVRSRSTSSSVDDFRARRRPSAR